MSGWDEGLTGSLSDADRNQVLACADLVGRAGARQFEIGYLHDDVPVEEAGWYCHAMYRGARLQVENQPGPAAAASALAQKLLTGAKCRCGRLVALRRGEAFAFFTTRLADGTQWTAGEAASAGQCLWRLVGDRWEPSCPVPVDRRVGPL